jgi:FtsH-binding integral membrane protein
MGDLVEQDEEVYEPQDAIAKFTQSAVIVGSAGLLLSAVQNTVAKQNLGAMGIVTKFGGTTAMFGMLDHGPRLECG